MTDSTPLEAARDACIKAVFQAVREALPPNTAQFTLHPEIITPAETAFDTLIARAKVEAVEPLVVELKTIGAISALLASGIPVDVDWRKELRYIEQLADAAITEVRRASSTTTEEEARG